MTNLSIVFTLLVCFVLNAGCNNPPPHVPPKEATEKPVEKPEYFLLRPEAEKAYGYSHAVKIGNDIKISGAVSMDDKGVPTAKGDLLQQMKNCYSDLDKILKHYGCTFDDVIVENVLTTNMPEFLKHSALGMKFIKSNFLQDHGSA